MTTSETTLRAVPLEIVDDGVIPLAYLDVGPRKSAAVVLLHSLGTDHRMWYQQIPQLSARYRVIVPSRYPRRRGGDGGGASLASWTENLRRILDRARVETAAVVGVSLGGIQGIAFAATYPERVRALVVADSFASLDRDTARRKIDQLAGHARSSSMAAVARNYVADTFAMQPVPVAATDVRAAIAEMDTDAYVDSVCACFSADVTADLSKVVAPTLVLWGELDRKTPRALSERIAAGIVHSRFEVIPGAGHLSNLEQPGHFNRLTGLFLEEHFKPVSEDA